MKYRDIYSDELEEAINSGEENEFVLLDVRTQREYDEGHIPGTILIDYYSPSFRKEISSLDREKTYYVICRSGNRSGKTCDMMYDMGFRKLFNLEGGMLQWMGEIE